MLDIDIIKTIIRLTFSLNIFFYFFETRNLWDAMEIPALTAIFNIDFSDQGFFYLCSVFCIDKLAFIVDSFPLLIVALTQYAYFSHRLSMFLSIIYANDLALRGMRFCSESLTVTRLALWCGSTWCFCYDDGQMIYYCLDLLLEVVHEFNNQRLPVFLIILELM